MRIVKYIKNSLLDFPAHIATIAFTPGCNFHCWYCYNESLINQKTDVTQEFLNYLDSRKGWIDGVVLCGGEPTLQSDIVNFIDTIKTKGFDVKLDTNGTSPEVLSSLIEKKLLDYIAMDVKAPFEKLNAMVGVEVDTKKLSRSMEIIKTSGVKHEFRTTVTPDLTVDDIIVLASLVGNESTYFLQPYQKPVLSRNYPEPLKIETLQKYEQIAKNYAQNVKLR